jgi:hypothetical protein
VFLSILRTLPKTGTLDVHTNIVACRVTLSKVYCIISLTTTKLKNDRVVISEEITSPAALQRMVAVQDL